MSEGRQQAAENSGLFFSTALFLGTAGLIYTGWFYPEWTVPVAGGALVAMLFFTGVRTAVEWPGFLAAFGGFCFFCTKDLVLGGPLGEEAARLLGARPGGYARQPDVAAGIGQAAAAGMCLLWLPLARRMLAGNKVIGIWIQSAVFCGALLAVAVMAVVSPGAGYGGESHLGAVVNRNAASGFFALAAIMAGGLAMHEMRGRRTLRWVMCTVVALLCTATVAELGSRGGLLALLAGAACAVFRTWGVKSLRAWCTVGLLAGGGLLLAPLIFVRFGDFGHEFRLELWTAGLRTLTHGIAGGVGGGGFREAFALFGGIYPVEGMRIDHPDSGWVLLCVEWAAVGVAVVACALAWLLRGESDDDRGDLRMVAEAGVVAWAVAGIGDISFHRAALLVIGVPLLAMLRSPGPRSGFRPYAVAATAVLALVFAGISFWTLDVKGRGDDPGRIDDGLQRLMPLDCRVNHALGYAAKERGDFEAAARYFTVVTVIEKSNMEAIRGYAYALANVRPDLARSFWVAMLHASHPLKVQGLLAATIKDAPDMPAGYWPDVTEGRGELLVVLADSSLDEAQRCYERWLKADGQVKAGGSQWYVLGAMARWGSVADMTAWMATITAPDTKSLAGGARLLKERRRDDLAWAWLAGFMPDTQPAAGASPDAVLKATVIANPRDLVSAARLLGQTPQGPEKLKLLRTLAEQPDMPAGFRVQLAHALRAGGQREESLAVLMSAVEHAASIPE